MVIRCDVNNRTIKCTNSAEPSAQVWLHGKQEWLHVPYKKIIVTILD